MRRAMLLMMALWGCDDGTSAADGGALDFGHDAWHRLPGLHHGLLGIAHLRLRLAIGRGLAWRNIADLDHARGIWN